MDLLVKEEYFYLKSMHVVLFEKNPSLKSFLQKSFQSDAFTFRIFESFQEYFSDVPNQDLVIDAVVYDSSGFPDSDLIYLRQIIGNLIPVLVLTDQPGAKARVRYLEMAALDCMTKPREAIELMLRLKILGHRLAKHNRFSLATGLNIDESIKDFYVGDNRLGLNHNEYLLAENFFYHPNKVFGRMSLLELVWHRHSEMESNGVEVTISTLRKKLKKAGAQVEIKSRRNLGYWLEQSFSSNNGEGSLESKGREKL